MNEEEIYLYSELQIAKDDFTAKRHKRSMDNFKYVILTLYLIFFASTAFGNDSAHMAALAKKKGFWGWTCEFCGGYNPPSVSTCQTCRKPRGY